MIAIIPAAGCGSRLGRFLYAKELLTIAFAGDGNGGLRPVAAAEHSVNALKAAGVSRCLFVVSDSKLEIVRYFGNGTNFGMDFGYVVQASPGGLAEAVDTAFPWVQESDVCLALPDTIHKPSDAIARIRTEFVQRKSDVVLGIFPTSNPCELGPVELGTDGQVLRVFEKPASTILKNTWGIAVWSPRFTTFLHNLIRNEGAKAAISIGEAFDRAISARYKIYGIYFDSGSYLDIGTPKGIKELVNDGTLA